MLLISTNSGKSGSKNTNRPPNTSTRPPQGQPHHPMPAYFDKYFWTHGHGSHKGGNYNSKAPVHKEKSTTESKMYRSSYGCTKWRCGTVPKAETKERNVLLNSIDSTSVPPKLITYKHAVLNKPTKTINLKFDTGATCNSILGKDNII